MSALELRIASSGLLLVSHLAAYGLGAALEAEGEHVFVGYAPDSLELEPRVRTDAGIERVVHCVHVSADVCKPIVDADLAPERPVIWARFNEAARAPIALRLREQLLDDAEARGLLLAAALVAGLGAPVTWNRKAKPSWGASQLDGVPGNSTSDFVRGVLRRARPAALAVGVEEAGALFLGDDSASLGEEHRDKTGWAPPGTRVHLLHQWLAALGLSQLPVGLSAVDRSRTPCFYGDGRRRAVRLPVPDEPVSLARLRALLQLPELTRSDLVDGAGARLRALGVSEVIEFPISEGSANPNMVAFSFARGELLELR